MYMDLFFAYYIINTGKFIKYQEFYDFVFLIHFDISISSDVDMKTINKLGILVSILAVIAIVFLLFNNYQQVKYKQSYYSAHSAIEFFLTF